MISPMMFFSSLVLCSSKPGVTNLFAIPGHFVSCHWVSGPHNFVVILWNLLKRKKLEAGEAKFTTAGLVLNASRAACSSPPVRSLSIFVFCSAATNKNYVFVHVKYSTFALRVNKQRFRPIITVTTPLPPNRVITRFTEASRKVQRRVQPGNLKQM